MSRRYSSQRRSPSSSASWILAVLVIGLFIIIGLCCGAYTLVSNLFDRGTIVEQTPTPEPATMILLGFGLIGLAGYLRRDLL
jgi:H+/Cl- antiporter ClcA